MNPFRASFGDIDLLVVSVSGDTGRDWIVHSPTRGDEHTLQDRGKRLKRATLGVCFCTEPGLEDYLDRWLAFEDLVDKGEPQLFVHPFRGSFRAVISDLSYSTDGDAKRVDASFTVIPLQDPRPVAQLGAGVAPPAGPEQVGVTTAAAGAEASELGLDDADTTSLLDDCLSTVEGWANAEDPDARTILLEVSSLSSRIDNTIDRLDLVSDLKRWELYRSMINLRYQIARAAEAVTSESARVFDFTVRTAAPLLAICARIYGASEAQDRAREVAKLNGLKKPGFVRAGTTLKMPSTEGTR